MLTKFLSLAGCYYFNKLPFEISSAPELFHKRMNRILEGLSGILCHMEDVLVLVATQEQHDLNFIAALKQLEAAGVNLNLAKCKFSKASVKFI